MRDAWRLIVVTLLVAVASLSGSAPEKAGDPPRAARAINDVELEISRLAARNLLLPDERDMFLDAARVAWRYGERHYRPASGLIAPVPFYDYATVWDIGSSLAMLFAARELNFLSASEYDGRMRRALVTLSQLPLFDGVGFNKAYQASTGRMVDRKQQPSDSGFGWSVTDIGRLLVWLKIVATRHPQFAEQAKAIAMRLKYDRLVRDGYLWGEDTGPAGVRRVYPEGQIGYEQYAAIGFDLWGARAEKALDLSANAIPIDVMGRTLAADRRQRDKLTSEPFVLMGLETGWTPELRHLSRELLAAQAERARRTGVITIMSEDAISRPPHYFYYYCLFANARHFSVEVQHPTDVVDQPRWISTKGAYAWHALFPSAYTLQAIKAVQPSRETGGWSSGVFENSQESTRTPNVNTAAVIMTAALYAIRGEPMLLHDERQ